MHAELDRLAETGITDRELAVAQGHLRADTLLSPRGLRRPHEPASARRCLLHGEVRTVEETLARIEGVERDDVQAAARDLLGAPRSLAVVGPFDPDAFDPASLGLAGAA